MKDLNIQIAIKIYEYEELKAADRELLDAARQATYRSYAPYSHFSVGAAARLANNIIVTGTNQENAAYPSGLCAERTTLFYANSQYPDQAVETLAIAARNERGEFLEEPIPPCGACRQVMLETEKRFKRPMRILLSGEKGIYELRSVGALLPLSFDASSMLKNKYLPLQPLPTNTTTNENIQIKTAHSGKHHFIYAFHIRTLSITQKGNV